ncbi:toll-like receptor 2 [Glandiceps talaboti]
MSLKNLELSRNEIDSLDVEMLTNLWQFSYLGLSSQRSERVHIKDDIISLLLHVEYVDLSNIDLSYSETYMEITTLRSLHPQYQSNATFHEVFPKLSNYNKSIKINLRSLNISYSGIFPFVENMLNYLYNNNGVVIIQHFYADGVLDRSQPGPFPIQIIQLLKYSKSISLGYNNIDSIPQRSFVNSGQLTRLDLSFNAISSLTKNTWEGLINLQYLSIQNNYFTVLFPDYFYNLPALVELKLQGNPLYCDCHLAVFLMSLKAVLLPVEPKHGKRLPYYFQDYEYTCSNMHITFLSNDPFCASAPRSYIFLPISLFITGIMVACLLVASSMWASRVREKFKTSSYSEFQNIDGRGGKTKKGKQASMTQQMQKCYDYDVNIVYTETDRDWAEANIATPLHDNHKLKVCTKEREFIPGYKTDASIKAISKSNKTIFVLSNEFIHQQRCEYELKMALQEKEKNRNVVLLVAKEDVRQQVRTTMLPNVMFENHKVYPNSDNPRDIKTFFDWLVKEIKTPSKRHSKANKKCCRSKCAKDKEKCCPSTCISQCGLGCGDSINSLTISETDIIMESSV